MDNRKVSCAFFRDITINNSLKLQYKFFISSYRSIILLSEFTSLTTQNKRNFSLHLSSQKLFFFFLLISQNFDYNFITRRTFVNPLQKYFQMKQKNKNWKFIDWPFYWTLPPIAPRFHPPFVRQPLLARLFPGPQRDCSASACYFLRAVRRESRFPAGTAAAILRARNFHPHYCHRHSLRPQSLRTSLVFEFRAFKKPRTE